MRETIENTTSSKFYRIKTVIPHKFDYGFDCYLCPREGVCQKHDACNQTKGLIRNWKEFRKKQYKEKR